MDSAERTESENIYEVIAGCFKTPENNSITSTIQRWIAPSEPAPVTVLSPQHPLLQKFQGALKTYLLKENEKVQSQINDLKNTIKKGKKQYENQMSQEMYQLEQDVKHQRDTIHQYEENLENIVKTRENTEKELQQVRQTHRMKMDMLNKRKKEDMELQKDLDEYNWIWKQYEKRKNETDCELAVSQRVSEKMMMEKKEKSQKQKDLDVMMYKLTTEVWNLQSKIALIEEQTNIKKQEMNAIHNRIGESTADMDSLHVEHGRLMNAWTSVIHQIQNRDNIYTKLSDEYLEMEANFHIINAEIDGVKKEITCAMQKHEELTVARDRLNFELENTQKLIKGDEKKKSEIEEIMLETNIMLEITENDLYKSLMENTNINNNLKVVLRELEKLSQAKFELENETLEKLQENLLNDKASNSIAATIRRLKEDIKKMELGVLTNENVQAKIALQIEQQKDKNERLEKVLYEEKQHFETKDKEINKTEDNIKEILVSIERKQTLLEMANKKFANLLEQVQGQEMSPTQRMVEELDKNISDLTKEIKELQQEWVRAQSRVVNLSEQKQNISTEINQKRKQIQILEHKNMKLENEINILKKEKEAMHRSINLLQSRVENLFAKRSEDHKHNQELERSYNHMTLEYVAQLKDAEEETINLEEQIKDLENEKNQLEIDLHKIKREAMSWQKMVILTMETKQKIQEEKGADGDVGKMKIEIHRMQVRQAQLSRLANRLADELAQGVVRREIATEKAAGDTNKKRINIPHSIKEKKSSICKLQHEIEEKQSLIEMMQTQENELQEMLNEKIKSIADIENQIGKLKHDLEDLQDNKQKNLENLVRIQHCGHLWSTIAGGRNILPGKGSDPQNELIKQMQLNRSLKLFIGQMINSSELNDIQKRKLQRALNTLKFNEKVILED